VPNIQASAFSMVVNARKRIKHGRIIAVLQQKVVLGKTTTCVI